MAKRAALRKVEVEVEPLFVVAESTKPAVAVDFPVGRDAASRLIQAEIANPRTRARLVAMATRVLGNEADAEDCVQEALIQAVRYADQFEGRSTPLSWLFRVVVNACRMRKRSQRRERRGGGAIHVSIDELVSSHPSAGIGADPEAAVVGSETLAEIAAELDEVPEADAMLFRRFVVEDIPLRTLAQQSNLTRQAVKSRLFRVRRRLAGRLGQDAQPIPTA